MFILQNCTVLHCIIMLYLNREHAVCRSWLTATQKTQLLCWSRTSCLRLVEVQAWCRKMLRMSNLKWHLQTNTSAMSCPMFVRALQWLWPHLSRDKLAPTSIHCFTTCHQLCRPYKCLRVYVCRQLGGIISVTCVAKICRDSNFAVEHILQTGDHITCHHISNTATNILKT